MLSAVDIAPQLGDEVREIGRPTDRARVDKVHEDGTVAVYWSVIDRGAAAHTEYTRYRPEALLYAGPHLWAIEAGYMSDLL